MTNVQEFWVLVVTITTIINAAFLSSILWQLRINEGIRQIQAKAIIGLGANIDRLEHQQRRQVENIPSATWVVGEHGE